MPAASGPPLRLRLLAVALVSLLWIHDGAAATRQVVVLNSYDPHAVHNAVVAEGFRSELERRLGGDVSFTEMNLDARWNVHAREPLIAELLRERQAYVPMDLIFAEGPAAIAFWIRYRDSIAPGAAMVATARKGTFEPSQLRPRDAAIWSDFSFRTAVEDILAVQPDTNRILMALGSSQLERRLTQQARRELADYTDIEFEFTNDYSLGEFQHAVRDLAPPAAMYLAIFSTDVEGAILRGHAALSLAHAEAQVPIFGPFDDQLGRGIVGGRLIPLRHNGVLAAETAARILTEQPVPNRWRSLALTAPVYDFRELERWSVDPSELPDDAEIRYRPLSVWQRYPTQTAMVVGFMVAQTGLILALLAQRRRLRRAERSHTKLAGLLVDAHETERRRIARELHDDVSQRLARLAIDAGMLGRELAGEDQRAQWQRLESGIGRVTEDVHDLSYRLHPSIVDDLGIVTALRTECAQARQRGEVRVEEDIGPLPAACPRDTALCIYRICQEALGNTLRHAGAGTVRVTLGQNGASLVLTVQDDGCGFDPEARAFGLGLSGMAERCRLLGGALEVLSAPGRGTSITARLPLPAGEPAPAAEGASLGAVG